MRLEVTCVNSVHDFDWDFWIPLDVSHVCRPCSWFVELSSEAYLCDNTCSNLILIPCFSSQQDALQIFGNEDQAHQKFALAMHIKLQHHSNILPPAISQQHTGFLCRDCTSGTCHVHWCQQKSSFGSLPAIQKFANQLLLHGNRIIYHACMSLLLECMCDWFRIWYLYICRCMFAEGIQWNGSYFKQLRWQSQQQLSVLSLLLPTMSGGKTMLRSRPVTERTKMLTLQSESMQMQALANSVDQLSRGHDPSCNVRVCRVPECNAALILREDLAGMFCLL